MTRDVNVTTKQLLYYRGPTRGCCTQLSKLLGFESKLQNPWTRFICPLTLLFLWVFVTNWHAKTCRVWVYRQKWRLHSVPHYQLHQTFTFLFEFTPSRMLMNRSVGNPRKQVSRSCRVRHSDWRSLQSERSIYTCNLVERQVAIFIQQVF